MDQDVAALGGPRRLEPGDLERATSSIARAFAWHEPFGAWALPDPADREQRLAARIRADIRDRFLPHGECWTIGAGACVTLWIPPISTPGTESLRERRSEADYAEYGERADALRAGDELLASLKPPEDHWYLDTIATAPEWRRRGLGARLLDHDLAVRDAAGDACVLDTHTPENIAFYARRGFEVTAEGQLPGGPDLYVMVRPAR